jgi:hypothetical protein
MSVFCPRAADVYLNRGLERINLPAASLELRRLSGAFISDADYHRLSINSSMVRLACFKIDCSVLGRDGFRGASAHRDAGRS